jgi:peptidoglycan/xylan/chitin deacetylase (PgdA/CDA1 family)
MPLAERRCPRRCRFPATARPPRAEPAARGQPGRPVTKPTDRGPVRRLTRLAMTLVALVLAASAWWPTGLALAAPVRARLPAATEAKAASPKTVVTFAWGGGLADQMPSLRMFREYGMRATYFVASGLVCTLSQAECQKSSPYLTLADLHEIAAYGNEIGGLSVTHQQLTTMPAAEAKREICDDRSTLFRWGFRPTDFAYPFALVNPTIQALTRACGYNAGLGTGTLRGAGRCDRCAWAETIPPKNPYNVRTPVEVNSVNTTWVPRTYESIVTNAQKHGGGWIIFTLHDICKTNCSLGTTPAILGAVLKWLHGRETRNTVVETMSQVIGGPVWPAVAGPAPLPLPPPGVANANLAQVNGGSPACFQQVHFGRTVASFTYQPGSGPHGSAAETIRVIKPGTGDALLAQGMDLGLCAPSVSSRRSYTAGMWYKSSQPARIVTYLRTSVGSWAYWTTSPAFPASASWRQASWNTPAVPPGTTALSFGLATDSGTISTADYSLKLAKSYKELILLSLLGFAIVAGALITRGHYRYAKYVKAEAAAAEAEAARAAAEAARAAAEAARAAAEAAKAAAEPVKARSEPAKAERGKAEDATVIMKAVNPAGTRRATGDWQE